MLGMTSLACHCDERSDESSLHSRNTLPHIRRGALIAVLENNHGFGTGWHCRLVQQCLSIVKELSRNTVSSS